MPAQIPQKRLSGHTAGPHEPAFSARAEKAGAKRSNRRGKKSSDRVIEAARRILIEDGYAGLSMARLREEAGVSSASLYHHFGDKAGLLSAVLERTVNENAQRFNEACADADNPLDRVENFLGAIRAIRGDGASSTAAIIMALAEARAESPEMAALAARANRFAERFIADQFANSMDIEDGRLPAHLHLAFSLLITHAAQAGQEKAELAEIFESFRKLLLILGAALRPDHQDDPHFASALAKASYAPRRRISQPRERKK